MTETNELNDFLIDNGEFGIEKNLYNYGISSLEDLSFLFVKDNYKDKQRLCDLYDIGLDVIEKLEIAYKRKKDGIRSNNINIRDNEDKENNTQVPFSKTEDNKIFQTCDSGNDNEEYSNNNSSNSNDNTKNNNNQNNNNNEHKINSIKLREEVKEAFSDTDLNPLAPEFKDSDITVGRIYPSNKPYINKIQFVNSNIGKIPDSICKFHHLKDLSLQNNMIKEIPESLKECKELHTLWLHSNFIEDCENIGFLTSLSFLNLYNNKITTIPPSFSNLVNLQQLLMNNNRLTNFEILCSLENLEYLCLDNNNIKEIPEEIGNLKKLNEFKFKKNEITKLPDTLNYLSNLTTLDLSSNEIEEDISSQIKNLVSLKYLNLKDNPSIGELDPNIKKEFLDRGCEILLTQQ
eukprot:TRINITY_DN10918_c0_g1_i1.p1 TRINITY_DN10918_c0_g1~~TRINITY_DN10918_c0_g1_i1.p1  ORF type:complete len:404 (+),score=99.89 TRINITY_DN10918_c0_g1_i1:66-1277(+)